MRLCASKEQMVQRASRDLWRTYHLHFNSAYRLTPQSEAGKHAALSYKLVLSKNFPTLFSLLRPSFLANAIALHPFGSLWGRCERYFKTER
jgi:hypothetical protein